jgi:hypothetical protein
MVKNTKNTVISQLQSVSEGALGKLTQSQATRSAIEGAMSLKDRGDKILRGLESIEERLTAIEKRLAAMEKKPAATRSRSTATKTQTRSTAAKRSTSSRAKS